MTTPPGWTVDLAAVLLSGLASLLIARHAADQRIDGERRREVERWYVDAGVQAELAASDWATEMLGERSTEAPGARVLEDRASTIEEHAAEGTVLEANEDVVFALRQIASDYRRAAWILERDTRASGPELRVVGIELRYHVDTVRASLPDRIEYGNGG